MAKEALPFTFTEREAAIARNRLELNSCSEPMSGCTLWYGMTNRGGYGMMATPP